MSENQKREILELLEKGKISAQEAADMLGRTSRKEQVADEPIAAAEIPAMPHKSVYKTRPTMFRVRVRNMQTGENKVTVNIPVGMLKLGLRLGRRFRPDLEGLDLHELGVLMTEMENGMLVEVQNDENNEHVQVYIE